MCLAPRQRGSHAVSFGRVLGQADPLQGAKSAGDQAEVGAQVRSIPVMDLVEYPLE
jgi:hypothetical protein